MRIDIDEDIISRSIQYYGSKKQSIVCMEECSELIQCISKELRGKTDVAHLTEEMADVLICIKMLQQIYSIDTSELESWIQAKQQRIKDRMESDTENDRMCNSGSVSNIVIYGLKTGNTECFTAAGLFAVACNIQTERKENAMDGD